MKRLLLPAAVIALLAACAGGEMRPGLPTPSPTTPPSSPTPAPTSAPVAPGQVLVPLANISAAEVYGMLVYGAYLVEVDSGKLWGADWLGTWSPDGKSMARTRCCIGDGGLDIIDRATGSGARIVEGDTVGEAWSPDGSQIAFSRFGPDGPEGLYIINRDGSGLRQVSDIGSWTISWSPRGDHIALQSYVLHLASGAITALDVPYPANFAWSPDGRWLAFSNDSGLYIYDPDTGDRRQVAIGPSGGPILWSPDGSRIVFRFGPHIPMAYGAYAGNPEVGIQIFYVVEVQGPAEPKPLPLGRNLSWSPDGTRIAYLSEGCITGEWDIYTILPDGSGKVRLTNTPETIKEGPVWSPTGSAIAFSAFDKLILVDATSGEMSTLAVSMGPAMGTDLHLHGSGWLTSPWSPDGRYIAFDVGGGHGICD